jgi:hypothetical protein
MSSDPTTEQLFWARELVQLARVQGAKKGVPDHVMAKAMLVQAYMMFTGQPERAAAATVSGLYANSVAKRVQVKLSKDEQGSSGVASNGSAVHSPSV